jgi:hypothetical protein
MTASPHPVFANVAYLRLPEFGTRAVVEQASLKEKLEAAARMVIRSLPADERVVLDAEDGLVLVVFGDSALALALTQQVNAGGQAPAVQAGLNYGPLALTSRGNDTRVFGDGLAGAAAASRFAEPGKLLVTQDFAKALRYRNPERAEELATAGDFTDTRVRQHSFYAPDARRGAAHRRRMLALGALGTIAILSLGFAGREARLILYPPPPAVVTLAIKPRGEVFVDGVSKGRVPGLKEIEIVQGRHVVLVKNPGAPNFEVTLDLKPGERRTITHTFPRPPEPAKKKEEPPSDFWRDLKKKLS